MQFMMKLSIFILIVTLLLSDSVLSLKSSDLLRARLAVRRNHIKGRNIYSNNEKDSYVDTGNGDGADLEDENTANQVVITTYPALLPADPDTIKAAGDLGTELGNVAGDLGREMGNGAAELGQSLGGMANDLGSSLGGMARDLSQTLGGFGRDLGQSLGGLGRNIGQSIGGMGMSLGNLFGSNLGQSLGRMGREMGRSAGQIGHSVGNAVSGIGSIGRGIGDMARNLGSSLGGMGSEMGRTMGDFGRTMGQVSRNFASKLREHLYRAAEEYRKMNGTMDDEEFPVGYTVVYPGSYVIPYGFAQKDSDVAQPQQYGADNTNTNADTDTDTDKVDVEAWRHGLSFTPALLQEQDSAKKPIFFNIFDD